MQGRRRRLQENGRGHHLHRRGGEDLDGWGYHHCHVRCWRWGVHGKEDLVIRLFLHLLLVLLHKHGQLVSLELEVLVRGKVMMLRNWFTQRI